MFRIQRAIRVELESGTLDSGPRSLHRNDGITLHHLWTPTHRGVTSRPRDHVENILAEWMSLFLGRKSCVLDVQSTGKSNRSCCEATTHMLSPHLARTSPVAGCSSHTVCSGIGPTLSAPNRMLCSLKVLQIDMGRYSNETVHTQTPFVPLTPRLRDRVGQGKMGEAGLGLEIAISSQYFHWREPY